MARSKPFVLLDDSRPGREHISLFSDCADVVVADRAEEVPGALKALAGAQGHGLHAAGFFSYELGYALEPRLLSLMPALRDVPLLWFGLFRTREEFASEDASAWFARAARAGRAYAGPLKFRETRERYNKQFKAIADYIAAGDAYQVNLTFQAGFAFAGDPLALYTRLRPHAGAGYGAYVDDGARAILSLSPELFFEVDGNTLTARPMKGTAARAIDPGEDARAKARLQTSEKERAENLMIVDLIRNDLGRVAKTGTVTVDDLFAIESYPTVHQMVSTVRAQLRERDPAALVRALFPCGSVTGAPKIRAMEIIRELESEPRGVYCGAVGAFLADGSASFNVAIRTLTIARREGRLGIGGGLVADSKLDAEYDECLLKARFYSEGRPPLSLIETLRFMPGEGFVRGALHIERMAASARTLGLSFDEAAAWSALNMAVEHVKTPMRARLQLDEDGSLHAGAQSLDPPPPFWTYAMSPVRVQSGDPLLRHKTSWRELFDGEAARLSREAGAQEVLFLNERGEVAEGSRTNVFVRIGGKLVTPPLSSGCLPGILRRALIESGECEERVLTPADLKTADDVYFGNSLRGLIRAGACA